ncbi:helicase SNF2 [Variovorax sp. ZS18.2.2]|uniref:helicase SNF2 n=1 Tax=Variovorax sp. ZS18.2.2 TaxID=2971255 RepID=UPI002151BF20|nr:helicase SNF2 [Variovorax sp. ZS18.2.2]MCR6479638.1 helicase SNF2 [Variovorax sp. ZS18.2.2]
MNTKQLIALSAAAFAMLGAAGAVHAETYEGVHSIASQASRADVRTEAVAAAHSDNPYAEGANAGSASTIVSSTSRAAVRAEAVAAAHSDNPYAEGASSGVAPLVASTIDRATVRAAARAAARGDALPL